MPSTKKARRFGAGQLVREYRTQKIAFFLTLADLIGWELLLIFYLMALGSRKAGVPQERFCMLVSGEGTEFWFFSSPSLTPETRVFCGHRLNTGYMKLF